MADDGNRQVAISLGLDDGQFETLDLKLSGIHGAVDKLAENVASPDTSVAGEIALLRTELGMRLTALNETIIQTSENLGKWLAAIALAAANPTDNTAEVQRLIDQQTLAVKAFKDKLQASVDAQI